MLFLKEFCVLCYSDQSSTSWYWNGITFQYHWFPLWLIYFMNLHTLFRIGVHGFHYTAKEIHRTKRIVMVCSAQNTGTSPYFIPFMGICVVSNSGLSQPSTKFPKGALIPCLPPSGWVVVVSGLTSVLNNLILNLCFFLLLVLHLPLRWCPCILQLHTSLIELLTRVGLKPQLNLHP